MDKVGGTGPLGVGMPFLPRKEDPKKARKPGESASAGFLGLLRDQDEAPSIGSVATGADIPEAEIEALLDQIHTVGQELVRYPSPENVVAYKKTIGRFVQLVVAGSLELSEVEGRRRKDLQRPKYALLKVIDDKLDKLGAYVLSNQKDHLELLRKVDELHGLLVDLRH